MGAYKRSRKEWKGGKPRWYFYFKHEKKCYTKGTFSTQKEAQDAENRKRLELKSKRNRPALIENVTVAEFMPKFLEHRGTSRAPGTVNREECRSHAILRHFKDRKLTDISTGDIHSYVTERKKSGLQNRSVNLEITFLRSFFKYAVECSHAEFNPAREVTCLKVVSDERWSPSQDELLRFIAQAERTPAAKVFVPWLWFQAYTGARPTESTYVEWSDVDFVAEQIHIRPKPGHDIKNGAFRVVEMNQSLKPILLKWKEDWQRTFKARHKRHPDEKLFPHNWVFYNPRNQDERIRRLASPFELAREKSGLPKMTPHSLRHFFISNCVMSGINFFTIAKWVGHSNTKMIEKVYGHLSPEFRRKQMGQLKIVATESVAVPGDSAPQATVRATKKATEPISVSVEARKKSVATR